jgi:hypothetical protein
MLYQLSYLGTARAAARERAVYSQAKRACPPSFACGYAGRGLASLHRQIAGKSRVFSVFAVIRDGDRAGIRQLASQPGSIATSARTSALSCRS